MRPPPREGEAETAAAAEAEDFGHRPRRAEERGPAEETADPRWGTGVAVTRTAVIAAGLHAALGGSKRGGFLAAVVETGDGLVHLTLEFLHGALVRALDAVAERFHLRAGVLEVDRDGAVVDANHLILGAVVGAAVAVLLLPTAFLLLAELAAGVAPIRRARGGRRAGDDARGDRGEHRRGGGGGGGTTRTRTVMRRGRRERVRPAILVVVEVVDVEARGAVPLAPSVGAEGRGRAGGAPAKERARALRRTGRIRRRGRAMAHAAGRDPTRRGRAADARGDDILSHSAGAGEARAAREIDG